MAQVNSSQLSLLNQPTDVTPIPSLGRAVLLAGLDVYNGMLYTLLITVPGTRPFFPDYGIGVPTWLFAPLDMSSRASYAHTIRQQVTKWIPQISITQLIIDYSPQQNGMVININYIATVQGLTVQGGFSNVIVQVR